MAWLEEWPPAEPRREETQTRGLRPPSMQGRVILTGALREQRDLSRAAGAGAQALSLPLSQLFGMAGMGSPHTGQMARVSALSTRGMERATYFFAHMLKLRGFSFIVFWPCLAKVRVPCGSWHLTRAGLPGGLLAVLSENQALRVSERKCTDAARKQSEGVLPFGCWHRPRTSVSDDLSPVDRLGSNS